jgi:pectin methylesterase-like acyl-CoA thioesterase
MAAQRCEVVETDEAGNVTATYVQTDGSKESLSRVDVIQPQDTKALWQKTLDIFLPSGYPHSVTDDYLE